jgi:hypothetical protein
MAPKWRLEIGDPTVLGWSTTLAFLVGGLLCFRAFQSSHRTNPAPCTDSPWIWLLLCVGLLGLAVNKQLDLQNLATDIIRSMAYSQGWYENRRPFQYAFGIGFSLIAVVSLWIFKKHAGHFFTDHPWCLAGMALLSLFLVLRVASIEHLDDALNLDTLWDGAARFLEVGGALCLSLGAVRHHPTPSRSREV